MPASAFGLTSLLTQILVLPAPVATGGPVERCGYESAVILSAGFVALGALVIAASPPLRRDASDSGALRPDASPRAGRLTRRRPAVGSAERLRAEPRGAQRPLSNEGSLT